jgi:hypothetical protein
MKNKDKIIAALKCADADLQGMVQRHWLHLKASDDDIKAAKSTRRELAAALTDLDSLPDLKLVLEQLELIRDMADSDMVEASSEHSDPVDAALNMLDTLINRFRIALQVKS